MSRHLGWRLVAVLLVLGAAGWLAATRPARLGLDLRGGTQIVLEAKDSPERQVDGDTVARTLEVLRHRVDQLGVAEPEPAALGGAAGDRGAAQASTTPRRPSRSSAGRPSSPSTRCWAWPGPPPANRPRPPRRPATRTWCWPTRTAAGSGSARPP